MGTSETIVYSSHTVCPPRSAKPIVHGGILRVRDGRARPLFPAPTKQRRRQGVGSHQVYTSRRATPASQPERARKSQPLTTGGGVGSFHGRLTNVLGRAADLATVAVAVFHTACTAPEGDCGPPAKTECGGKHTWAKVSQKYRLSVGVSGVLRNTPGNCEAVSYCAL